MQQRFFIPFQSDAKELTVMVMIYLGLQYLVLCYPLLLLVGLCLCLPVLVLISFFLNGNSQRPADEREISKQKLRDYKKGHEDFAESMCCICQCEYNEEDKIIMLECNKKYIHFYLAITSTKIA